MITLFNRLIHHNPLVTVASCVDAYPPGSDLFCGWYLTVLTTGVFVLPKRRVDGT